MLSWITSRIKRLLLRIELAAAEMDAEILRMEMDAAPLRLKHTQDHIEQLRSELHTLS